MTVDYLAWDSIRTTQTCPPATAWWRDGDGPAHACLLDTVAACGAARRTLDWQPGGDHCGICAWLDARGGAL